MAFIKTLNLDTKIYSKQHLIVSSCEFISNLLSYLFFLPFLASHNNKAIENILSEDKVYESVDTFLSCKAFLLCVNKCIVWRNNS